MEQKLMDCFTHPIKCKLLLELYSLRRATAKELAKVYADIPQATLYRHLKHMTEDGVLKVVEETQVRGMIEKTYAPAFSLEADELDMTGENAGSAYMQMFMQYILGFIRRFQEYTGKQSIDIARDMSGFSLAPIYATDEELRQAMAACSEIILPLYKNKPGSGRKPRTLGMIISPPEIIE